MVVIVFNGILLIILGMISLLFAVKLKPNWLVGYRSMRANSNQETYLTANYYAGKFLVAEGVISLLLAIPARLIPKDYSIIAGVIYFIAAVTIMFVFTEIHLKRNFDE